MKEIQGETLGQKYICGVLAETLFISMIAVSDKEHLVDQNAATLFYILFSLHILMIIIYIYKFIY